MTVKECYEALGGGYDEVLGRMRSEERVKKFILRFLTDPSYELLKTSLASGDGETAFRAAHTLKGVSQSLELTRLYESSHKLTEELRHGIGANAGSLMEEVTADYQQAVSAISQLQDSQQ